jgi:hypothetical protein
MSSKARPPEHVVHRAFSGETVILNLNTGQYHGLNPTGGRFLSVLEKSPSIGEAVELLASEYERSAEAMESDVRAFCRDLLERGLIEISPAER